MAFLGIYRAVYDYAPQNEEELEITAGDLLFVLEKSTDDPWWKCRKKGGDDDDEEPEGLVPENYIEEAEATHTAKALYDYTKQTDEELSFKEDARLDVYDDSDPDWTLVAYEGQYGFAPAIYIETVVSAPAKVPSPAPPSLPARRPVSDDEPIPGEADYVPPSDVTANSPAAALAGIIAQKTGGAQAESRTRQLASPPPAQYTPEASDEEEEMPPPKPARPQSVQSPISQYTPSGTAEAPGIMPSPPQSPTHDEPVRSSGSYHLYNIHEMISYNGRSKKLPTTLGINTARGMIMISPEKTRDGPGNEWSAEKLTHYSIEGKHVFVELVRPSKSVDFHAGAKDTAHEIVARLGELAGASRAAGLTEVLEASKGSSGDVIKKGQMLYEFMAQSDDEVTVAAGDEVLILDDTKSEEWWMVRRLRNGKEGVVPSSYIEITGTVERAVPARTIVEQNRLEEERLAKEASRKNRSKDDIPERGSSLATSDSRKGKRQSSTSGSSASKSRPNPQKVRTWTDRSGTFRVEAEFIGLRDEKIHLHKLNGIKIAVPVAKMSVEDIEYVERVTNTSLEDDKPLSDIKRKQTQKTNGTVGASVDQEKRAKDEDYWFDFFLSCGVDYSIVGRYTNAFVRDQMGPEILPDVNPSLLRTLGLKEGDILRVMKHLDAKFGRQPSTSGPETNGEPGGLLSGPGGVLKNNTRKSRPAPAVLTNDVVDENAFRNEEDVTPTPTGTAARDGVAKTPLASAPAREPKSSGFDDDAWDVRPARTQTPETAKAAEPPRAAEPPKPLINDDIASLSISTPALQPTPTSTASPATQSLQRAITPEQSAAPQQPQGADKAIFDKIAALAPARARPQPPPPVQNLVNSSLAPPPRSNSAPGFPQGQGGFGPPPLQPQLTGYGSPQSTGYGQQQYIQSQPTAFIPGQQTNGYLPQQQPQPTGIQAVQNNYPALQPQPTGLAAPPQSNFGQQLQNHYYGPPTGQQSFQQQQFINGAQTGSPFADPVRPPYQPHQPSSLHNSFTAQQTGFQPGFMPQPTGYNTNGYPAPPPIPQQPQLPPQQTGGVFGPSQPVGLNGPPAPLLPQKTGPPPPVRFGVQPGQSKLAPQPTGRANLSKATPQNPFGF